ncbi:hypothetical protein KSP40_PGU021634 [Platanthera guangdongensis]|uniref:Uncharacterized protein n=1 Tax=Platanthera guangdongensis TaxID=2320717 RepID=A0ABR2MDY3_9ASPA
MRRLWNSEAVSFTGDADHNGRIGFMFTYVAVFSMLMLISLAIFVCAGGVKERKIAATEPQIYDGTGCGAACAACGA